MKVDNLKFVRFDRPEQFDLIPRRLFDQVKGTDNITDRIYQFGPLALANPLTFLYVLVEKNTSLIKGVLWAEINPLNETLFGNVMSLDKDYQGNGILDKVNEVLEKIRDDEGLKKIQMTTNRPEAYIKKYGWKQSEKIILER